MRYAPTSAQCWSRLSSSTKSETALAATMDTGSPPKVESVRNRIDSAISGRAVVTPTGSPLARPFAPVMTSGTHRGLFKGVTAALALVVTVQILRAVPDIALIPTRFVELRDRHYSQQAYAFARQNPGTTYFPWHMLASLMAEGKLYHTEGGLAQWEDADFPVSEERLRSHLPLNMRYLAFIGPFGARSSERLPEFSCRVEMPELPGWTVLAREGRSCRPND